eukprot:3497240-Rhodomonas_salina.1
MARGSMHDSAPPAAEHSAHVSHKLRVSGVGHGVSWSLVFRRVCGFLSRGAWVQTLDPRP